MQINIKSSCLLVSVLAVYAANASATTSTDVQIAQLKAETQALSKQLTALQTQLNQLQHQKMHVAAKHLTQNHAQESISQTSKKSEHDKVTPGKEQEVEKILTAVRYAHGLAVVASPFLGARSVYDNSDLIVNLPSLNTDLRLLEQKQKLDNYSLAHHETTPDRPLVDISGGIEAQALTSTYLNYTNTPDNPNRNTDIDLTRVELDVVTQASDWATGEIIVNYENLPSTTQAIFTPGSRVTNSRLKVDRAFITIGNLNKSPIYGTIGQIYVPFGIYNNAYVTDPLTKTLGRIKERVGSLAFIKNGFYGSIFAFQGDSYVSHQGYNIDNCGLNLGYKVSPIGGFNTEIGVSAVANIADSEGMQSRIFGAQLGNPDPEQLRTRVPAVDAYLSFNYEPFTLLGEYLTATRTFDIRDISYNNHGAKPSALDVEGIYNFNLFSKNSSLAFGYGRSWETLALQMPQHSLFGVFATSLWKYTIESLEYRHNINFPRSDIASFGSPGTMQTPSGLFSPAGGRSNNSLTFQIGMYF